MCSSNSKEVLEAAISFFLEKAEDGQGKLLYRLYYEQKAADSVLDLAFDDSILEDVEKKWKAIVGDGEDNRPFMQFEERAGVNEDDEINEGY